MSTLSKHNLVIQHIHALFNNVHIITSYNYSDKYYFVVFSGQLIKELLKFVVGKLYISSYHTYNYI